MDFLIGAVSVLVVVMFAVYAEIVFVVRLVRERDAAVSDLTRAEVRLGKAERVLRRVWGSRREERLMKRSWKRWALQQHEMVGKRDAQVGELKAAMAARLEADAGSAALAADLYRDGGKV
jgi:hypothetical protein